MIEIGKRRLVTVRFAPKSGHSSVRIEHVCFVPEADMAIGLKPVGPQVAGRNRQLIN